MREQARAGAIVYRPECGGPPRYVAVILRAMPTVTLNVMRPIAPAVAPIFKRLKKQQRGTAGGGTELHLICIGSLVWPRVGSSRLAP